MLWGHGMEIAGEAPKSEQGPPLTDPSETVQATASFIQVFISYASQDAAIADAVVAALERDGLKCWIAPRDITPGEFYADAIVRALNEATILVLVLTANAVRSSHVLREIERASAKRHAIISLRLTTVSLPPALEYFLSASQWLDASAASIDNAFPKLIEAVGHLIAPFPSSGDPSRTTDTAKTTEPPLDRPSTGMTRRLSLPVVALSGVTALLLAYFAVDKPWLAKHPAGERPVAAAPPALDLPAPTIPEKSVAVLPFVDMSEKHDQEYFADGMVEEILDLLAKLPGLKVIGRTSSFQFKGKSDDLRAIGARLGAAYVVEGSVRKFLGRTRVTAQLIATRDGSRVWSDTYDKDVGEVLKMQDQIAAAIVRALQVSVGADDLQSRPTLVNVEAYDLYLRGRHAFDRFDKTGFETAAGYFQQALELDPTSARVAEWLASTDEFIVEWGFVPPDDGYDRARKSVQRALKLNPQSGVLHSLLSTIHTVYDWDWPAARAESDRAIALDPRNPQVLANSAEVYQALGELDNAEHLLNAAFTRDPLFAAWHEVLGNIRFRAGRLADAEAELRKTLEISPSYGAGHYYLGQILLAQGRSEEGLAEMRMEDPDSGRDAGLAIAYYAMRRKPASDMALGQLTKERAGEHAFQIAQVHAYRGELDHAFKWLDRAYSQRDAELYWIKGDPLLKNLEGDPRYKEFLRKLKLPE
jgi:TolB-like protein